MMAALSDRLLALGILGYVTALLFYTIEYAFGSRGAVARTAVRIPRERQLVGAGVGGSSAPVSPASVSPVQPVPPAPPTGGGRAGGFGLIALGLNILAALVHGGALVTRGLAAGRVPWGNMYEFVIALSFVASVAWLVLVATRPTLRLLGLFVTLALSLVLGFAALVLTTAAGPL